MEEQKVIKKKPAAKQKADGKPPIDFRSVDRITIFTADEAGEPYGFITLKREDMLHVSYNGIKHEFAVTLKSITGRGQTQVQPVQNGLIQGGEFVPTKNSYTMRELYEMEQFNHTLVVKGDECKKFFEFLRIDEREMDWDGLMRIRENMLQKIAEAKVAAQKRQEEENKKQAEKDTAPILGPDGEPARKDSPMVVVP